MLSERRVKQDQSDVEDTLSANRQSVLEEDFSSFIDDDREDVRDRLKEMYNVNNDFAVHVFYPRLACLIFEVHWYIDTEWFTAVATLYNLFVIKLSSWSDIVVPRVCGWNVHWTRHIKREYNIMCLHPKLSAKRGNVVTLKDNRVAARLSYGIPLFATFNGR